MQNYMHGIIKWYILRKGIRFFLVMYECLFYCILIFSCYEKYYFFVR